MDPMFLTLEEVLFIHREQIDRFGGSHGVRDSGLLRSALAQPEASFGGEYLHVDLCEMAAAYLYHVAQNHPFIDGNKRVGLESALVFLQLNGLTITASGDDLYAITIAVATSRADKATVADFFGMHAK